MRSVKYHFHVEQIFNDCDPTRLEGTSPWRDRSQQKMAAKVMIIGVGKDDIDQ